MTPILIHIQPFDIVANARTDVRIASALEADAYGLNATSWAPALTERPQMSIEIMSADLSGRVQVGRTRFAFALENAGIASTRQIKWGGASVKVYSAEALAWPAVTEFDGDIVEHSYDIDTGILTVTAEVSKSLIEKPLLTLEFDGSGGAGGDAEKRGTFKPAGFGSCENVPPVMFDSVRNIGMIDGYGNCTAITKLMEGASDMGASVGDYASYAALAAAIDAHTIPPGRWGTCIAEGLVGLGAPPVGVIGVNATFGYSRLGAMMSRILTTHAGVSGGQIDSASFTALDTALNYPTHHWTASQVECKSLLEAMARSGNATLLLSFQRRVSVSRGVASASVATLDRSGRLAPRCIDWKILPPMKPVWRVRARAARPGQVLSFDQINYVDTIIDRGAYNGATVYRAGNVVWLADKSSWLYTNLTAGSGNAPPTWPITSNAYWQNLTPPVDASGITYPDGTPIADLQPSDPEATRNSGGQALQDTVFLASFWSMPAEHRRFASILAPGGYALELAVLNGAPNYTDYDGTRDAYFTVEPGKPLFFRAVVAPRVVETFYIVDGADALFDGASRLIEVITSAADADWDLVATVTWFTPDGVAIQTDTIFTATPAAGEIILSNTIPAPAGAYKARIAFGHPTLTGKTGSWSVWAPWVAEYQPAADVTATAQVVIELVADKTIAADYSGAVTGGNLALVLWNPAITRGGTSIKLLDETTYALSAQSGGTFVVDNTNGSTTKGQVTITAMSSNNAQANLVVTVAGVAQPPIVLRLSKMLADPPTSGSAGGYPKTVYWTGGEFVGINTTSYTAVVSPIKTVTLASGETLYGTASLDYIVSGLGGVARTMTVKFQYSVAGANSWSDFAAGVTGSIAYSGDVVGFEYEWVEPIPGYVSPTQSAAPAAGDYDVRLVGIDSTTGRTCTLSGTAIVEAKV